MSKFRGNLQEAGNVRGGGEVGEAPPGAVTVKGGEVQVRDDNFRSKAQDTRTPVSKGRGIWAKLPGKEITGAAGAKGRKKKWTAQDAAAALGKRC